MRHSEWKIPYSRAATPESLIRAGFSPLMAALLASRGMKDPQSAIRFLEGKTADKATYTEMDGVEDAVCRIKTAIEKGEKTAVFGDYDVDGITAACLMCDYLRYRGLFCEIYIPDRMEEGYGLNLSAIDYLCSLGVTLIVTVDCGVTAIIETEYARSLGIDTIITDHHECRDVLPDCVALIDPKRRPDIGFEELSGVGVVFRLVCALHGDSDACLDRYCDLVAIGTIADVMPLTGENRRIIKRGLQKLIEKPRPGIRALLDEAGITTEKLSAASIGFSIAPRINAAGRLGRASLASSLLLTDSTVESTRLAKELCELNLSRRKIEQEIWEQALTMLPETPKDPIIISASNWHQGVIGIVASRLSEEYSLPTIMICFDGDHGKGSCRSFGNFNCFDALSHCSELLDGFGGHALAAGLTLKRENLESFRDKFIKYYHRQAPSGNIMLEIDLLVDDPELITMSCVDSLREMEPYGYGNPRPVLCITSARLESLTPIGDGKHLRIKIGKFGQTFECVFFSCSERNTNLAAGDIIDIAFYPQINEYRSRRTVQLLVKDMRRADDSGLWREILSGGVPLRSVISPYIPCRRDFVRIWRTVTALGGRIEAKADEALTLLDYGGDRVRACICLAVFAELGLLSLDASDDIISIITDPEAERVDLSTSRLLRHISM